MQTGQRDKKIYYLVGIVGIFLLIGLWSSNYFGHEVKDDTDNQVKNKDNDNEVKNQHNTASENVNKVEPHTKTSEVNDVFPPKQCAIKVNAIYTLGLVGVYHWFNREYIKQAKDLMDKGKILQISASFTFILAPQHYIVAVVVMLAMACYIGYFVSQNYSLDATCAKDMAILFVGMPLLFEIIVKIFIEYMSSIIVLFVLGISIGFFSLATLLLPKCLYNNKLALLKQGWSSRMQWLCSACVLAYLYYQTRDTREDKYPVCIFKLLLWCISVAFLCVQLYWSPQPSLSSGNEKIDYFIAWPFWTINLWLGLVLVTLYDLTFIC